jgi:hypothetical protein
MEDKLKIKQAVKEILWMARRYADGRATYAPQLFNEAQKVLQEFFGEDVIGQEDKHVINFPSATDGHENKEITF